MKFKTTSEVFEHWHQIKLGRREMDADDKALYAAVERGLDSGIFYSSQLIAYCAKELKLSSDDLLFESDSVDGGCFGYNVYTVRQLIEDRRAVEKRKLSASKLSVGQIVKDVSINGNRFSTVTITGFKPDGIAEITAKKRGSNRQWSGWVDAICLDKSAKLPGIFG